MMLEYRKASIADLEMLTRTRVQVLRAANLLSDDTDMSLVEKASRSYYETCFQTDSHTAYLVFDKDLFVGSGGVSYYTVMPTYHNPTGRKAYIMNMYTHPDYRRRGIARHTLELLVEDARRRGVPQISLEATDAGKPLYLSYGFTFMKDEMELL